MCGFAEQCHTRPEQRSVGCASDTSLRVHAYAPTTTTDARIGPCPVTANRAAAGAVAHNPVLVRPDLDAAVEGAADPARRDLQKWAVGGPQTTVPFLCIIFHSSPSGSVILRSCAINYAVSNADSGSTTSEVPIREMLT